MSFLTPAPMPLRLNNFRAQSAPELASDPDLLAILKTTALVESRADKYAEYLHAVFRSRDRRWREAVESWNDEERQHGALLRQLVAAADPAFDFDSAMQRYEAAVPYHVCDGRSVRGSIAGELVARCVVEALASTFYRTLRESLSTSISAAALVALARDEARHYGMFVAMLREEQEGPCALGRWRCCWVGFRRMTELGDQQIIGAYVAACTGSADGEPSRLPSQRYAAALYPRYRLRHLLFAARLIRSGAVRSPRCADSDAVRSGVAHRRLAERSCRARPGVERDTVDGSGDRAVSSVAPQLDCATMKWPAESRAIVFIFTSSLRV